MRGARGGAMLLVVVSCVSAAAAMGAVVTGPPPRGRRDVANTPNALMRGNAGAPTPTSPVEASPPRSPASNEPTHFPAGADLGGCRKPSSGKRLVRVTLKPEAELGDLIAWISSITCKQFLLPGTIPSNGKKVTVVAPQPMTREDAYQLFLGALDSVGLTVQPTGRFLRIIETSSAKSSPIPFYAGTTADAPAAPEPTVTRLVRVEHTGADEAAARLGRLKSAHGEIVVATESSLIITDSPSNVDRMLGLLREIDRPTGGGEKP